MLQLFYFNHATGWRFAYKFVEQLVIELLWLLKSDLNEL
jgi:hypothetical protein